MQVIPSIDVAGGRSRIVFWPGVSAGVGAPTDRPERIAQRFVELGARVVHVVDFDGARSGTPGNLESISRIAATVAVPLQVAGGLENPDAIRLAFAAGATRVVLSMSVVEQPDLVRRCLEVAGDWLAVGLDLRPAQFAAYPWRRTPVPDLRQVVVELAALGVGRFVLAHAARRAATRAEFLVAGGPADLGAVRRLRDAGIDGLILGEPLLSGALDFGAALEAAA